MEDRPRAGVPVPARSQGALDVPVSRGESRPVLLRTTIRAVAAIGCVSYAAAVWFSSGGLYRSALGRFAARDSGAEPTVTGALADAASRVRLDPCARPRP